MQEYNTVFEQSKGEYTEKHSKFFATLCHVESEQEAFDALSRVRSENFGANHNTYAYVLADNSARFSDDGEPHGTAGRPILDLIKGSGLKNIMIIVTRYFGGILLGTGGLVRSYSTAAKEALENSKRVRMCECASYSVPCPYSDYKVLQSVIEKYNGFIDDTVFADNITIKFHTPSENCSGFEASLLDTFSSKISAKLEKTEILPISL